MSNATYRRRKAAGQCPWCTGTPAPRHIYCPTCLDSMRAYGDAQLTPDQRMARTLWRKSPTAQPATSQQAELACCGRWQKIESIPHICAICGARYLEENIS